MKVFKIVFIFLMVSGCAAAPRPTIQQIASADYGPFPSDYEQVIKEVVSPTLIDPYSAVFNLTPPKKGWNNMIGGLIFGWNVCGSVNAKNRYGGYVGAKPIYAMIRHDRVVRLLFQGLTIPDSVKMGIISGTMTSARTSEGFCRD